MRIILHADAQRDIFTDDLRQFELAFLDDPAVKPLYQSLLSNLYNRVERKCGALMKKFHLASSMSMLSNDLLNEPNSIFMILMGADRRSFEPYRHIPDKGRMIYMFDAWPKDYHKIRRFINEFGIDLVFVSAAQSAADLNKLMATNMFHHVAEGIDTRLYKYATYEAKDIEVLALGRKYDRYHQVIRPVLSKHDYTYLYETTKGQIIFEDRKDFIDGLSRTKISICVPGSITHPERSGHVETMTMRYLQSMASKCLIVGHAPEEMIRMFGYNPVIEIDWNDPEGQIIRLLRYFHLNIPLIEKNYKEVNHHHTWTQRFHDIKRILTGPSQFDTQEKHIKSAMEQLV